MYKLALAVFAGFCIAITMVVEIGTPYAFVVFVAGFVTRQLLTRAYKHIYGTDLATLWKRRHPLQHLFWQHAHAFARGLHLEKDPRDCRQCMR